MLAVIVAITSIAASIGSDLNPVSITGPVDEEMVRKFEHLSPRAVVDITSEGGNAEAGFRIAKFIDQNEIKIRVKEYCLSACAEFFLPAAASVSFIDKPLVAVHLGDLVFSRLGTLTGNKGEFCSDHRAIWLSQLYLRKHLNREFALTALVKLQLKGYEPVFVSGSCWSQRTDTAYFGWLPTSQQMKDIWGLTTDQALCADEPSCVREKAPRIWGRGTSVIVGDVATDLNAK